MKISIITPCYNSAQTIADNMRSVQAQTYQNIEHIIVDGLSKDNTLDMVNALKNDKTKVISEKDNGLYDAINKGIKASTGDLIGVLNSDDLYDNPQALEHMVNTIQKTKTDAVYADLCYVETQNTNNIVRKWRSAPYHKNAFLYGWMPAHPTFYLKKTCYDQYGLYLTQFKISADYELMLRMFMKHQISSSYLPEYVVKMRVGGVSNSSWKNRIKANQEDRKAWEINGLKPYFFTLFIKPLRKLGQFF
jgi:glycosyltransferase involved in cell wall biosynthesis